MHLFQTSICLVTQSKLNMMGGEYQDGSGVCHSEVAYSTLTQRAVNASYCQRASQFSQLACWWLLNP